MRAAARSSRRDRRAPTLGHIQPARFNAEHATLLQAIASQAAIAIERTLSSTRSSGAARNELVALNALSREISVINRSADLYGRLPLLIQRALGYPIVSFWLQQGGALRMMSQAGVDEAGLSAAQIALALQQVAAGGQPAHISGGITGGGPASGPAVPRFWNARVSGVVGVHSVRQRLPGERNDRVLLGRSRRRSCRRSNASSSSRRRAGAPTPRGRAARHDRSHPGAGCR